MTQIDYFTFEHITAALLAFIPGALNLVLGIYLLAKFRVKQQLILVFSILVFDSAAWQIADGFIRISATEAMASDILMFFHICAIMLPALGLHFTLLFCQPHWFQRNRWVTFILYAPPLLLEMAGNIKETEVVMKMQEFWSWVSYPTIDLVTMLELSFIGIAEIFIFYLLISHLIQNRKIFHLKMQSLLVLSGFFIPFVQGMTTRVFFPLAFDLEAVPLSSTFLGVLPIAVFIALARYKLLRFDPELIRIELLNKLQEGIVIEDNDNIIQYVNKPFEKFSGYKKEELIGSSSNMLIWDKNERTLLSKTDNNESLSNSESFEHAVRHKNGDKRIFRITGIPYNDETNEVIGTIGLLTDVTNQKKTESDLEKSKIEYQKFYHNAPDIFLSTDLNTKKIVQCNDTACKATGYSRGELIGMHIIDLFEGNEKVIDERVKEVKETGTLDNHVSNLRCKNGDILIVSQKSRVIKNEKGLPIKSLSVFRDLTKLKEIQNLAKAQEREHRELFEFASDAIIIFSQDAFKVVNLNKNAIKLSGRKKRDMLNKSMVYMLHDSYRDQFIEDVKGIGKSIQLTNEYLFAQKDGPGLPVEISMRILSQNNITVIQAFIRDVSKRKQMELEMLRTISETEDKERSRFALDLHDGLGQLLLASRFNLLAIKGTKVPKDEQYLEMAKDLMEEAIRETRSISHNLMPRALDDLGLINGLEDLIHKVENSLRFKIHFDHNIEGEIHLTKQQKLTIYRVCQEFISNTSKYAKAENLNINIVSGEHELILILKDDGKGFDIDQQSEGLGIEGIKKRILALQGTTTITSENGDGCKYEIMIPILD